VGNLCSWSVWDARTARKSGKKRKRGSRGISRRGLKGVANRDLGRKSVGAQLGIESAS
jgi:hypothetical protein